LPLVSTLREVFDIRPTVEVLIAAAVRNEQTFEAFVNVCSGSLPSVRHRVPSFSTCAPAYCYLIGRYEFGLEDNDLEILPMELQDGPFYSAAAPIRILTITGPQE
jgi:hypothetical protein